MNNLSDKEIIAAFAQADEKSQNLAIKYMYVDYFPVILNYINNNNGTEEDAADIFQDALLVFYHKSRKKDFELKCTVKTYLYSICKNMWLYRLRSRKKEIRMNEDFETIQLEEDTLALLIESDHKKLIARLMDNLGEKCKQILTLVYFDRLKMEEIAHRVEMSNAQVVRNQKSRCMKKLKSMIEQSEELLKALR